MKHDDQLDLILSVLRHEMGNSVTAVKITLDVLRENFEQFDTHQIQAYLERGSVLVGRQHTLLKAMQSYAKSNVGNLTRFTFAPVWERFTTAARELAAARAVTLAVDGPPASLELVGDSLALCKSLQFILENALEAVDGQKSGRIELGAAETSATCTIRVADNGCGMDGDQLPKATVPLYTTKPDNMGMGLPIACKLIAEMGGETDIESTPGVGTRVRIILPKITNGRVGR